MIHSQFARPLLAALVAVATIGTLACRGDWPPTDHAARLARAAEAGLPTDLRPEWGLARPHGMACAAHMRDARDSVVQLVLIVQDVRSDTTRHGDTTLVHRWVEGEYAVTPAGRYAGLRRGPLRVDCSRGEAIAPPSA